MRKVATWLSGLSAALLLCGGVVSPARAAANAPQILRGRASFYGKSEHGSPTASGKPFNMYALTAAHRTLRLGSVVRVRNLRNGKEVTVRINDRGPYVRGRIIDLSYAAAARIGMIRDGVVAVRIEVLSSGPRARARRPPERVATREARPVS